MSEKNINLNADSLMSLRDVVYHALRDAILKGELEPGERLMEIHLANRMGVSRTPIREAIRMLEHEGLAVTYPRRGARVAKMTVKDLDDVIEIRETMDILAGKNACNNITDGDIVELKGALADFENAIKEGHTRRVVETDEAFHNIIYRVANNPKLMDIVVNLREQMYRYRYEYIKHEKVLKNLAKEHARIVEGLEKRDKTMVEELLSVHLANQYEAVKSMIKNQER